MIICVSPNPAIDRRLRVEQLNLGRVSRASSVESAPGGKAAHVAMVALALGAQVTWLGFLGGQTGEQCERGLVSLGIPVVPVRTKSETRVNLEIIDRGGVITEVLEPGGRIQPDELSEMLSVFEGLCESSTGDAQIVLSGSLPPGTPVDLYAQMIGTAHRQSCKAMLDTSREPLLAALEAAPDFVKPNREEAEWAVGAAVNNPSSAAARWMIERGARSAAVSLGAEGLLWLPSREAEAVFARPPRLTPRSTVGCGDAAVAGFAVAAERRLSATEAVRLAAACGAANCIAEMPGMVAPDEVTRLSPLITVS